MKMKKQMIAAMLSMAIGSMAFAGEEQAYQATAADAISTGAALATPGVVELNPLGWATVPLRLLAIQNAKSLPREEAQPQLDMISASSWGAAANNVLVMAGVGAAAPVVGLVVGYAVWRSGEKEREFWQLCAVHQKMSPGAKCEFANFRPQLTVARANEQLLLAPVGNNF
jgi:hypothetical protein